MIVGKVVPKVYKYLKVLGKSSSLEVKPLNFSVKNPSGIKLDLSRVSTYTKEEVESAYQMYARSPYINSYLRGRNPLSEQSNILVDKLRQGIAQSAPKTGKFYRGLMNCPDEKAVSRFIFNNKGFTSVTPEINKNFAQSFALGRNGAVVEFDIKTPLKGYQSNNYEVLFDTNAFTPDKYEITKVKEGFFRVSEKARKQTTSSANFAHITSHYTNGNTEVFGCIPDNYVVKRNEFIEAHNSIAKFGPKKGQLITHPERVDTIQISLPHYHIDKLYSAGPGTGTRAVQEVVKRSVANPKTTGRVTLDACCIDGKTSPAGFYYKLGFRFNNPEANKALEEWLAQGGNRESAPFLTGIMHLPKENIERCLQYGKNYT